MQHRNNYTARVSAQTTKLFLARLKSTPESPVKSESTLIAQSPALCSLRFEKNITKYFDNLIAESNNALSIETKALIELMGIWGLRVSEALSIKASNVTRYGSIFVDGLKGSQSRLIHPNLYLNFWKSVYQTKCLDISYINRFYIYRIFNKSGIFIQHAPGLNKSVTHALRYIFIANCIKMNMSTVDIQNVLGHKNINSTLHYINSIINENKSK